MLLLVGCGDSQPLPNIEATVEARVAEEAAQGTKHETTGALEFFEVTLPMEEELLALAHNRDAWFLASDITTEALEGLYGSWSVICQKEISLADYKAAVFAGIRPWLLETLQMELTEAQAVNRYYKVEKSISPWAYVEQTWKVDDKIVLGPDRHLYLIESGAWRYHDC